MFNTGFCDRDGDLQLLGYVCGGGAVSVGCLHNAQFQLLGQASLFQQCVDEVGQQRGYLVTVEQMESEGVVDVVEHHSVGVTVEGAVQVARVGVDALRQSLVGLDEVSAASAVQHRWVEPAVVGDVNLVQPYLLQVWQVCLRVREHLQELRSTYTVCRVDDEFVEGLEALDSVQLEQLVPGV